MASDNHNGLHPADMERIRGATTPKTEEFTVQFKSVDNSLTLTVDGAVRNRIKLNNANDGFEVCLNLVKDQFIKWRSPKN